MPDTTDKIKAGIDESATKMKHVADKVGETTKVAAGEMDHPRSKEEEQRKDASRQQMKPPDNEVDAVTAAGSELANGARAFAERAAEKSKEAYEQLVDYTQEGVRHAGAIVRANPVSTMTLAFAVGVGVGVIIGLSPRRKKERWSFRPF